jgi:hypothetical protein
MRSSRDLARLGFISGISDANVTNAASLKTLQEIAVAARSEQHQANDSDASDTWLNRGTLVYAKVRILEPENGNPVILSGGLDALLHTIDLGPHS